MAIAQLQVTSSLFARMCSLINILNVDFSRESQNRNLEKDNWEEVGKRNHSPIVNSIKLINRTDKSFTKMKMKLMKVGEPSQAQKRESLPQVLRFSVE